MNKEKKSDVFLNAIIGTKPIKRSNRNYQSNIIKEEFNEKKNIKKPQLDPPTFKEKKRYQEDEIQNQFKIEKLKINKKLKKGTVNIDRRIDLHGLSVKEAKILFLKTVEICFVTQKRCILFITGKGMTAGQSVYGEKKLYYGKIRNEFLSWTKQKTISRKILSVEQASIAHGGDGAFFVYLRKNRN